MAVKTGRGVYEDRGARISIMAGAKSLWAGYIAADCLGPTGINPLADRGRAIHVGRDKGEVMPQGMKRDPVGTIGDQVRLGHTLTLNCESCRHRADMDLAEREKTIESARLQIEILSRQVQALCDAAETSSMQVADLGRRLNACLLNASTNTGSQ
jgi:hypothetical protein